MDNLSSPRNKEVDGQRMTPRDKRNVMPTDCEHHGGRARGGNSSDCRGSRRCSTPSPSMPPTPPTPPPENARSTLPKPAPDIIPGRLFAYGKMGSTRCNVLATCGPSTATCAATCAATFAAWARQTCVRLQCMRQQSKEADHKLCEEIGCSIRHSHIQALAEIHMPLTGSWYLQ